MAQTKEEFPLERCHIKNYAQEVLCGNHDVFEDRKAASGRIINIKYAVIPSVTEAKELDPLVLLAGGPGQGSIAMAPFIQSAFTEVHENRDVVLIDQRGMGDSHSLACEISDVNPLAMTETEQEAYTRDYLKKCLSTLDADLTKYNQDIANEDIHEILVGLGYDKVNLYGVSWGTRSALLYATQFPEHVRTIIMDGNAPIDNRVPLFASEDSDRAIHLLFDDCEQDKYCKKAYPNLKQDFHDVLNSFGTEGKKITLLNANTGKPEEIIITRNNFANAILGILYVPDFSRVIPTIIEQAKQDNYQALSALSAAFGDPGISVGAQLSILCSEDLSRIYQSEFDASSKNGFAGSSFFRLFQNSCSVWPKASLPTIYTQSLKSELPTLLLSGAIDPITPPRWGDKMAEYMTNSLHLVAANTGHNVAPKGCASKLMAQFINEATFENIDGSCLDKIQRPSFFIDGSGPARSKNND